MSENGIAQAEDFRKALERECVEHVVLPASGLTVLLCRPPVFASLRLGREGTELQNKITEAKPEEVKSEDIAEFSDWITRTLAGLFVQPRFSDCPEAGEIGLGDILVDDLKFIFRWLRGEVFGAGTRDSGRGTGESPQPLGPGPCTEDLAPFPGGTGAPPLSGRSGET